MNEIWKDVPGYVGHYKISNYGKIKSFKRGVYRILKPYPDTRGYLQIDLFKIKRNTRLIHSIVAEVFLNHNPDGTMKIVVDHINNNKLDNRSCNLQLITQRENSSKDNFRRKTYSKYIGVCWRKDTQKWIANIRINGKTKHLGYFTDELEAAKAYKSALNKLEYA